MSTVTAADPVLDLLPDGRVLVGDAAREWSRGFGADAVVFPANVDETRALVRVANETGTRLLPAGSGSWLGAGGWSRAGCVVVSTEGMDAVRHYEPADLTLTAGAGLGWAELAGVLRPNGQWLPVDPPGARAGTVGAAVACGVSGPLQGRYGATRDNVLGLEVVTGDGRVLRIGGRVVKNVAGYDLVRLLTGSRGSLGIITSVSVRLFPRPETDRTLLFAGRAEEAVATARKVCTSALPVAAVEVVEGAGGEVGTGGEGMVVAVRVLGGAWEAEEVCARVAARVGVEAGSELRGGDSEAFHEMRIDWEGDAPLVVRLAALPDQLERTLARGRGLLPGLDGEVSADAPRGLVRVKGSPRPDGLDALAELLLRTRAEMEAAGGTLTLSQAPARLAARAAWTGTPGDDGGVANRIKTLFDPDSILSAGSP